MDVETAPALALTESAAKRVAWLIEQEDDSSLMLRVSVSGGGCSGFQYGFSFDKAVNPDDRTFERDGVVAVIDETSLELLAGSEIDFVEDLGGSSFQIRNPNATSSCGCGSSFAI
ncbi:MAG TPA: iron-sulfur cluster insertion protein ErpA [Kiloniellaceae bacterium]|nr:iron-sulfur cluster insertion protein ErpA [Kiloniellaceae bacterium]